MLEDLEKECWGLDVSLAKHILPRLLYFKNWVYSCSYPNEFEDEAEWNEILEELTWTFTYISNGYPSIAIQYIDDVVIVEDNKNLNNHFVQSNIVISYTNEELYLKGRVQDEINVARCQQGLKLFAEFYMNLWN